MYGLHRGYLYQDLLAAFLISENLQYKDFKIALEFKENSYDCFDDVIYIANGQKVKLQIKHTSVNQNLGEDNFTSSGSDLDLANLSKSFLRDVKTKYIVATNKSLVAGTFFKREKNQEVFSLTNRTYKINSKRYNKDFLNRFFLETNLPNASFDLSKPGSLEKELFESLRLNVGIGYYPNDKVSLRDVASRLISLTASLRAAKNPMFVDRDSIFKNLNLNFEYGHISQNFPFISSEHRLIRRQVVLELKEIILRNKFTVLEGLPGSGKSHIFDDISKELSGNGVLVAKHFCYLEPTDIYVQERISVDTMYGNFLQQLKSLEPILFDNLKPYFAATKTTLEALIQKITQSGKKVVLMVDGFDHLHRVIMQNKLSPQLLSRFISDLLDLKLPKETFLFIASQPNTELLAIIKKKKAEVYNPKSWDKNLITEFIRTYNNYLPLERQISIEHEIIEKFAEKTEGNPLYITYVLKDITTSAIQTTLVSHLKSLPKLNKDLNNYYSYLAKDINDSDFAIVQTLALLDFSVSQAELEDMFPPILSKGIVQALSKIKPILKPGNVQSGIRIYHESFRRFIIEHKYHRGLRESELYSHIVNWLERSGFFISQRAYRYLIPYLIRAKQENRAYCILKEDFFSNSLIFFHSIVSIVENLNKIASYSATQQRWDVYCKAVELRRAVHTYSQERYDSADDLYHEAILNVQGANMFCERLLFDGKPVFSDISGILMCQMAEHAGGNPPWDFYDVKGLSMQMQDNAQINLYYTIESAHYLKSIIKSSKENAIKLMHRFINKNKLSNNYQQQIKLLLEEFNFVFGVSKNYTGLLAIKLPNVKKDILKTEVARHLKSDGNIRTAIRLSNEVLKRSKNASLLIQCIKIGGNSKNITYTKNFLRLTREILKFEFLSDKEKVTFEDWYMTLQVYSYTNPTIIEKAIKLVNAFGWYRAWIDYLLKLSLLEASRVEMLVKAKQLENALKLLNSYSDPFIGKPRAVDLWNIREISKDSFRRTLILGRNQTNFPNILKILSRISEETTRYLHGSSGGPLTGEEFNSLLKELYPSLDLPYQKQTIKFIENNTKKGISTTEYYDAEALEYLKLAIVFALDKQMSKSKVSLKEGCIRLTAYGFRKDITIFEIIDPIKYISEKNMTFAIQAFQKTYPLAEIVWRRTDGSETDYASLSWFKVLISSNLKLAIQSLTELSIASSGKDWRREAAIEYLCDQLLQNNVNPETIADLYETLNQTIDSRIDISTGLAIIKALLDVSNIAKAQSLLDSICSTLYWVSIRKHVSEKENFQKILTFTDDYQLTIKKIYFDHFKEQYNKVHSSRPDGLPEATEPIKGGGVNHISFSKLSLHQISKVIENNTPNDLLKANNIVNLARALSKLDATHSIEVKDLLLSLIRRNLYLRESVESLVVLRDIFLKSGRKELAAYVSILGFVYARGGGGWYALADSEYNYLASEGLTISKSIALKTLSSEMSYLFVNASYFIGPVRHLIAFFATYGKVRNAEAIWLAAYEIIKFRIPANSSMKQIITTITPTFDYSAHVSIDKLLQKLIEARKMI